MVFDDDVTHYDVINSKPKIKKVGKSLTHMQNFSSLRLIPICSSPFSTTLLEINWSYYIRRSLLTTSLLFNGWASLKYRTKHNTVLSVCYWQHS